MPHYSLKYNKLNQKTLLAVDVLVTESGNINIEERVGVEVQEDGPDLNWVELGARPGIKVDSYPARSFSGEIVFISDEAEFTPRNVQTPEERTILVFAVTVRMDNPEGLLKPGLPADVILEESQ